MMMPSTTYDNEVMMEATTHDVDDEDDYDTRHVAVDTFFFSACGLPAGDQPQRPVSDQKNDQRSEIKDVRNHFARATDH